MNIDEMRSRILVASIVALSMALAWIVSVLVVNIWKVIRGGAPVVAKSLVTRVALRLVATAPVFSLVVTPTHGASATTGDTTAVEDAENPRSPFRADDSALTNLMIGGAIGAGVLSRVRVRNTATLRSGHGPDPVSTALEAELARDEHDLVGQRLDIAVRCLGGAALDLLLLVMDGDGGIRAEFASDVQSIGHWRQPRTRVMELSSSVSTTDMIAALPPHIDRLPVLFCVGRTVAGDVWVNLETMNDFALDIDEGADPQILADVWRGLTESLALSPFTENIGLVGDPLVGRRVFMSPDTATPVRFARATSDAESTTVIITSGERRGDGVVPTLRRGGIATFGVLARRGDFVLQPSGVVITPVGCDPLTLDRLDAVLDSPPPVEIRVAPEPAVTIPACVPSHSFIASILGTPEVRHASGDRIRFEKSKSEELVMWLSLHPTSRRRSLARDAMWSVPVRDATFCNVTSDARRSLSAHEIATDPDQWVGVTGNDELPLHPRIVSDFDVMKACLEHARRWPEDDGIDVLRYALSLVRGVPFAGSGYLWGDSAALAGEVSLMVARIAQMCADLCDEADDHEGAMWATSRGLVAVPGHEGLVETRLRRLSARGCTTELRAEWESYCHILARDAWGDGAPPNHMSELFVSLLRGLET